jgi:hypothetical protein
MELKTDLSCQIRYGNGLWIGSVVWPSTIFNRAAIRANIPGRYDPAKERLCRLLARVSKVEDNLSGNPISSGVRPRS